jgi:hypothetical protein
MSRNESIVKEEIIRGQVMLVSAKIELILCRIIILSNVSNPKDEIIKFKKMMMGQKIEKAKKCLSETHANLFAEHQEAFSDLDKVKEFRNIIAHCPFRWHDPSLLSLEIWDVNIHSDGQHVIEPTVYTMEYCVLKILELQNALIKLLKLDIEIENILKTTHPEFSKLIKQGDTDS